MSRIAATLDQIRRQGRKALVPYLMAGDPAPERTVPLLHAMVAAGADLIELGAPFSDPMADGPVIQRASERALAHKMNLRKTLALAAEFRGVDTRTPLVLMGYLNPIEAMGYAAFVEAARDAGIDGVLTVDMPPEESGELVALLESAGIDPIYLLAPTSTDGRVIQADRLARGYLYYVSLKGVTGAGHLDTAEVQGRLAHLRTLTRLPLLVGFGVKSADTAAAMARVADGVVVGSALISLIENHLDHPDRVEPAIRQLLAAMREALDRVPAEVTA